MKYKKENQKNSMFGETVRLLPMGSLICCVHFLAMFVTLVGVLSFLESPSSRKRIRKSLFICVPKLLGNSRQFLLYYFVRAEGVKWEVGFASFITGKVGCDAVEMGFCHFFWPLGMGSAAKTELGKWDLYPPPPLPAPSGPSIYNFYTY